MRALITLAVMLLCVDTQAGTVNSSRTGNPVPVNIGATVSVTGTPVANHCVQFADSSGNLTDAGGACLSVPSNYSQAVFAPGSVTAVTTTKWGYGKIVRASTVDNLIASAVTFTCSANPVITLYECGTSATCASPTTIGSATVTAAGQAFAGTISSGAVAAGDYIAWATSAGTCTALNVSATAELHTN